jgi:hypothetical protein
VTETFRETSPALAGTTLSDHDLLLHALAHIEDLYEKIGEIHGAVMRVDGHLSVFAPLLAKWAPGGKPDMIGLMQARREARRGR